MLTGERATKGWATILRVVVCALLCAWGNAAACHPIQVKQWGTTNPKDRPCFKAVPCSLSVFKILSRSCSFKSANVNDKEKQVRELLDTTVLSMWMYPPCLHAARCSPCQLAELHPLGMALQLCNICLAAQLKVSETVVDQDRNSKTVSLQVEPLAKFPLILC